MNRRFAIKQVLIMAGGLMLLPSCLRETGKSSIQLKNLAISLDQEDLMAEIAESIIPKTDTPGARDLNLHLFVLKMLDDCYEPLDQIQFVKGLDQFKDKVNHKFSKSFSKLSGDQRRQVLLAIENSTETLPELSFFYKAMKQRTIGGYLNSKYVMTNLVKWELVPGRYNSYFQVQTA